MHDKLRRVGRYPDYQPFGGMMDGFLLKLQKNTGEFPQEK